MYLPDHIGSLRFFEGVGDEQVEAWVGASPTPTGLVRVKIRLKT